MGPEKNIEYQFMENYQIKYEARHGPVPAYQFRENISLHNISLERVYCTSMQDPWGERLHGFPYLGNQFQGLQLVQLMTKKGQGYCPIV